ncbi:MAG: hypothetical protein PHD73_09260 [Sediminibacterium sp.]|nr:hypothetical protein [Sediminibacterium sp.]
MFLLNGLNDSYKKFGAKLRHCKNSILTSFKSITMGKAKSSRKNTKKPVAASGMVSKPAGPGSTFGKATGGAMGNKNFSSSKKGGFSVTPRKAS